VGSWRDLAAQRVGDGAIEGAPAAYHGITGELASHLRDLEHMPAPRGVNRRAWAGVVTDALRLARDGWARSALALGWTELDLFGVGPNDSWEFSGLAVWLAGRPIIALDARIAFVGDAQCRSFFNRGGWAHGRDEGLAAPLPLWRFGRS